MARFALLRRSAGRLTIAIFHMDTVTLSPEFQVVIPRAIREALHLTAGEKLHVMRYADRVEFIPVRSIREMRGFLRGIDTSITRDDDRL